MADLLDLLRLDVAPVDNRLREYNSHIGRFEERLRILGDLVGFSCKRDNSAVHGKLMTQFRHKWSAAKDRELERLRTLFGKVAEQVNGIVALASESVNLEFTDQFEYIFESVEIQEKQVRSRLSFEEIPQDVPLQVKEQRAAVQTKHKVKNYSDLFSPAEVTVECLDVSEGLVALGGWDGCVSLYSSKTNMELNFLAVQPVSEVPIKEVRLFKRMLFVRDQQHRLSVYFVNHHDLDAFRTVEIGSSFVWISKRVLDRNFALLTVRDSALRVVDLKSDRPDKVIASELLKSSNCHLLNFKNKVVVICHRSVLLFDNLSRTVEQELAHCLHHDFEEVQVHGGHYLAGWSHQTFYYDELKADSVVPVFSISLELRPSLFKVQNNVMFLVSGGHVLQVLTDKRVVRVTQEEMFEFGVTDLRFEMGDLYLTGRDDRAQLKLLALEKRD